MLNIYSEFIGAIRNVTYHEGKSVEDGWEVLPVVRPGSTFDFVDYIFTVK